MERCPNCRARLGDGKTCRRCGMELGLLQSTEQAAEEWLHRAIAHLMRDEPELAEQALHRTLGLRRDPLAESLLGLLSASTTVAASADHEADEEAEVDDVVRAARAERIPGRRLRALYNRLFHRH